MPKVSVIIPVYGVEKYIERCARSLFGQTLDSIEYIFIDDCTPDKSIYKMLQVLDEYPHRKNQVFIHRMKENSGQAKARVCGIQNAKGDYIIHCDSDDWIDPTMYEVMYANAVSNNSDIVVCDYQLDDGNKRIIRKGCTKGHEHFFLQDMCSMKNSWSLCNKLVRASLYSMELVNPIGNMGEDMVLSIQLALKATKISYLPSPLYFYYCNPTSITHIIDECSIRDKFFQYKTNVLIVQKILAERNLNSPNIDMLKLNVLNHLLLLLHIPEYYTLWKQTKNELNFSVIFSQFIPVKEKFKYLLEYLNLYPSKSIFNKFN